METFIQILIFGLSNGAVLALNAIGVTLIYSTVRTLNLAHGDVFALTSALVTSLVNIIGITQKWHPLQLASGLVFVLCLSMLLGAVLSMGVERFGFRPFRGSSRLAPLIATLGISFILFHGGTGISRRCHGWLGGARASRPREDSLLFGTAGGDAEDGIRRPTAGRSVRNTRRDDRGFRLQGGAGPLRRHDHREDGQNRQHDDRPRMVQAIISTGALVAHGLSESVGKLHYRHEASHSDEELFQKGYNRVYDTLEMESNLNYVEHVVSLT